MADLTVSSAVDTFMAAANQAAMLAALNITLGGAFATSGSFALTLTITGATNVTLPTSGTLAILGANTFTGAQIISVNGAASTPALLGSGTIFTGGTATTTKPYWLIEPSGTTSTGWSTAGTLFGANGPSGFGGNLLDLQVAGVSKFKVEYEGSFMAGDYWQISGSTYFRHTSGRMIWTHDLGALQKLGFSGSVSSALDAFFVRKAAAVIQLGADAAGVTNQMLTAASRITSDGVGANLTIAGGNGRGAAGGDLIFATYTTEGAATIGELTSRMIFDTAGNLTLPNTLTVAISSGVIWGATTADQQGWWGTGPVAQPAHIDDPIGDAGTGFDTVDLTTLNATLADIQASVASINAMFAATGLTAAS